MNIDTAIQYISLRLKEFGYLIFKEYSILVGIQQTEDIIFPSLSYYLCDNRYCPWSSLKNMFIYKIQRAKYF